VNDHYAFVTVLPRRFDRMFQLSGSFIESFTMMGYIYLVILISNKEFITLDTSLPRPAANATYGTLNLHFVFLLNENSFVHGLSPYLGADGTLQEGAGTLLFMFTCNSRTMPTRWYNGH
jgi:hypothetical protein